MKTFFKELFTPKGRWNRLKYWVYPLVLIIPALIAIGLLMLGENNEILATIGMGVMIIVYILQVYIMITAIIKRLRDLDKNPWMTLLIIVPLANLYLLIICAFMKGTKGPNKFGPDPLGNPGDNEVVDLGSVNKPAVENTVEEVKSQL